MNQLKTFAAAWMLCAAGAGTAIAGDVVGKVADKEMREPLAGASIRVLGTSMGTTADMDGNFRLRGLKRGNYTLEVSYVSFFSQKVQVSVPTRGEVGVSVELASDNKQLGEVTVVARKNLALEKVLLMERKNAVLSIENLGAKEMAVKGISNVQEGVTKLTGISVADAGQLIVRGLGDRYSTTTLNGLPIASPNPDNKLIPLDIFPSSAVQHVTVSKVYEAGAYADYSGAHVDIGTRESGTEDFCSLSLSVGGRTGSLGRDFYRMDSQGTLLTTPKLEQALVDMPLTEFDRVSAERDVFSTTFDVSKSKARPDLGGSLGWGHTYNWGALKCDLLASAGIESGQKSIRNAYVRHFETSGRQLSRYDYDAYEGSVNLAGLFGAGLGFRRTDRIGITAFVARNAQDTYTLKEGVDAEDHLLTGSHQNTHIYMLQNYQLAGHHVTGRWTTDWAGSYSMTASDEPDRRQVMFERLDDGSMTFFRLTRQETMRYYATLDEDEWAGDLRTAWHWGEKNKVAGGVAARGKERDYRSTYFYYNLGRLNATVDDLYQVSRQLNFGTLQSGTASIMRKQLPRDSYSASMQIMAAFVETDWWVTRQLMCNVGLRMEHCGQQVDYADDGGEAKSRKLDTDELFPALNIKYMPAKAHSLRLSASRTVTRPSFVEMSPFLYQASYGAAQIRGNELLENGYNYNLDLRYECIPEASDNMLAITAYYKYLDSPIERTQRFSGGAVEHSFQNASHGLAAGVELEGRWALPANLRAGLNLSYMYTNVRLPEGGAYTHEQRPLQGASPILVNADLTYAPHWGDSRLTLALLYNLQGERIQAVGISGLGDVKQRPLHTLGMVATYAPTRHWTVKLKASNLLDSDVVFRQDIPQQGVVQEVERYGEGVSVDLGVTYSF